MTTPHTKPSAGLSPVVELRQYDLVPGKRDTLIAIFDSDLVEGQELEEMVIIGQFRDLDNPDSFVWLRGFADMEARRRALTGFYSGPVWLANRDAANATMLRFDNVLLLKPAAQDGGFALRHRRPAETWIRRACKRPRRSDHLEPARKRTSLRRLAPRESPADHHGSRRENRRLIHDRTRRKHLSGTAGANG